MAYTPPSRGTKSFTCPHCGVLARQYHWGYQNEINGGTRYQEGNVSNAVFSANQCEHCGKFCLWVGAKLVYPDRGMAPLPNLEMPPEPKADYEEAAQIVGNSPRAAAALLRLAIQKLAVHLGGTGDNLNQDIGDLVAKGLPLQVQQALDVVRVIGNNSVHPGQIDANDAELAAQLFPLVNIIVEYMIEMPKRTAALYKQLPESAKAAIAKRDSQNSAT